MKKIASLLTFIVLLMAVAISCNKDEMVQDMMDPDQQENPGTPGDPGSPDDPGDPEDPQNVNSITEIDITVLLPPESEFNLTGSKILSGPKEFEISGNNNSKIEIEKNSRNLVILLDSDDNPMMMGFVTEEKKEISITTTAEAVLYFRLGTVYLPEEVKVRYFNEASTLPNFSQFSSELTELFVADPKFLTGVSFQEAHNSMFESLLGEAEPVNTSTARLNYQGDIRSGIQIEEKEGNSVSLINTTRRRAHGFIYKVSSKDLNDNETIIISDIKSENSITDNQAVISPKTGVTDYIGTLQNVAGGKGIETARTESSPVNLDLKENENEANYKVRVVGPSIALGALTSEEEKKLRTLEYETLGLDIVLPILLNVLNNDKFLKDLQKGDSELYVEAFKTLLNSLPSVNEALKKGDYKDARDSFFQAAFDNRFASNFEDFYKILLNFISEKIEGFSQDNSQRLINGTEQFFKALDVVNIILQANDLRIILSDVYSANMLEEWDVTATKNKVTLVPNSALAIQSEQKRFKVEIQDSNLPSGQSYEYRYSTTGNYGTLRDVVIPGKEGKEVISSQDEIIYFSSSTIEIPEDAEDKIFVDVYIKQGTTYTQVNTAEAKVKIKPIGFEIAPDGITISGGARLTLNLRQTDGKNPIENSTQDYRIVWETPASFGLFNGSQNNITKLNDTKVVYEALEKEREGQEQVRASVYSRKKGTTDSFNFLEQVSADITVENDENKDIFYVSKEVIDELWAGGPGRSIANAYGFAPKTYPDKDVVSYSLRILEHLPENGCTGLGKTWYPANAETDLAQFGRYVYVCGSSQLIDPDQIATALAYYHSFTGVAQVTVILKPKE